MMSISMHACLYKPPFFLFLFFFSSLYSTKWNILENACRLMPLWITTVHYPPHHPIRVPVDLLHPTIVENNLILRCLPKKEDIEISSHPLNIAQKSKRVWKTCRPKYPSWWPPTINFLVNWPRWSKRMRSCVQCMKESSRSNNPNCIVCLQFI